MERVPPTTTPGDDERAEPGRLLVVDDNIEHLRTLAMLLESAPHECQFCHDGVSAIAAAREREFDLLLSDVRMAPLDGVETARAIKGLQPHVAVILMTGFDKEDTPLAALRLGAVDYIDKPITDFGRFLRTINRQVQLVHSARQLRQTRERLETVVRSVDTGVVVIDSQGRIEHINQAAVNLLAPGERQPLGRDFRDVCRVDELVIAAPATGTLSRTLNLATPQGDRFVQIDATRLDASASRPAGTVLLIRDLTALADWQKAEGWRQMSRAITHGMKTPLGTLRLRLEHLKSQALAQAMAGEVDQLLAVVGELHGRLSDLVDFVKLDVSLTTGELNQAVHRALAHFEPHRAAATRIEFTSSPQPLVMQLAPAAVGLAVENLLANSQEAAPAGVRIQVTTAWDAATHTAAITVEDDGPGVPPEVRADLFLRPLNSTKPAGTGLGAALVKHIVDQHRGTLEWQSPARGDRGTRVTIRLPQENRDATPATNR